MEDIPGQGPVRLCTWKCDDREIIGQFVLPILGTPKAIKGGVDGYFDSSTRIKGSKEYYHADLKYEALPDLIRSKVSTGDAHHMRPVAAVCREGVRFSGTLGAENCSTEEIAALLCLLDQRVAGFSFKLGLGKGIGLGSVSSRITKVWIRDPESYCWQQLNVDAAEATGPEIYKDLDEIVPATIETLQALIKSRGDVLALHDRSINIYSSLDYGKVGNNYWKNADVRQYGK
jgi:hypothetical protein